jgi:hypothetical protein
MLRYSGNIKFEVALEEWKRSEAQRRFETNAVVI